MQFDLQPTLKSELLDLRPLEPDDFENLYAVASDPKVWEQHPLWDRYKREVFEKFFEEAIASKGALAVCDSSTGEVLGSSRYYDLSTNEVFIGYTFLARKCWGGKYNGEMKSLMLDHAFKFVDTVKFHVGHTNLRSQKAMAKIGAKHSYTIPRDARTPTGQEICSMVFVIGKSSHSLAP